MLPDDAAVGGAPSLIQVAPSGGTQIGNFELLVPSYNGGILHLSRNNSASDFPWSLAEDSGSSGFGGSTFNPALSVALIQNDYGINPPAPGEFIGGPGTLECVVQNSNGDLVHWYLDQATGIWTSSVTITNVSGTGEADGASPNPGAGGVLGIGTAPAFIQPSGGYASLTHRNFEVVVGVAGYSYLAHYYRDNSQAGGEKWHFTEQFGSGCFPALILSSFGSLEVVVSGTGDTDGLLAHWWRDAGGGNWAQSALFAPGITPGLPGFIQDVPPPQVLQ